MTAAELPWQASQWRRLMTMQADGRLPHALLLRGPEGAGKSRFAERLLAALLCESTASGPIPCGGCRSCRLVAAGTHPDRLALVPPEGKARIGIDQVRALIERIGLTAHYGGRKAVVVAPAEAMTRAAANTLLKTLEEPPGDAVFVLVSHRASALPATIRSRCQLVDFPLPDPGEALPWLAGELGSEAAAAGALRLAHGAPLAALDIAGEGAVEAREAILESLERLLGGADPVATAQIWRDLGLADALYWLMSMVCDLVRVKNGRMAHSLTHSDREPALQGLARGLDLTGLFRLFDVLVEARRAALGQLNFNEQLVLESIAIEWQRCAGAAGGTTG